MLQLDDVQRPQLILSELDQRESWAGCEALPNPAHRWNVHLNQLTLATLLPWIEQAHSAGNQPPQIWPNPQEASQLWEWLNGTLIETTSARLLLIPTDTIETSELRVPQEWVDIPTWIADYYVMVQLNPDEGLLQIRGYVTHRQLKQGEYSADDRTYAIDESALVQDLDLLWVMAQLEEVSERRSSVAATVAELSEVTAEAFIQQWNQQRLSPQTESALQPRLFLPFEQWAALLNQRQWRDRLYKTRHHGQTRHHGSETDRDLETQPDEILQPSIQSLATVQAKPVQLSQWLEKTFEPAWLALEQLFGPQQQFNLRQSQTSSVSRGKVIYLGALEDPLILCTTITTETDGRVGVRIQLRSPIAASQIVDDSPYEPQRLMEGLQLKLLSPTNNLLQTVMARPEDDYIQLTRFKVSPGQTFSVEARLGKHRAREEFQV